MPSISSDIGKTVDENGQFFTILPFWLSHYMRQIV
jgi:hypothetical protein